MPNSDVGGGKVIKNKHDICVLINNTVYFIYILL